MPISILQWISTWSILFNDTEKTNQQIPSTIRSFQIFHYLQIKLHLLLVSSFILSLYWSIDDETTHLHIHPHKISYLTKLKTYTYFVSHSLYFAAQFSTWLCFTRYTYIRHLQQIQLDPQQVLLTIFWSICMSFYQKFLSFFSLLIWVSHCSCVSPIPKGMHQRRRRRKKERTNRFYSWSMSSLSLSHTFSYWLLYMSIDDRHRVKTELNLLRKTSWRTLIEISDQTIINQDRFQFFSFACVCAFSIFLKNPLTQVFCTHLFFFIAILFNVIRGKIDFDGLTFNRIEFSLFLLRRRRSSRFTM